jgi:hypothetical protein
LPSTGDLSFGVLATGPLAMAESVLSMEGAAAEGARLVYRGLWRSKEGREPSEAEATAVDMVSTEDGRLYSSPWEGCCTIKVSRRVSSNITKKPGEWLLQTLDRQGGPVERVGGKTSVAGL